MERQHAYNPLINHYLNYQIKMAGCLSYYSGDEPVIVIYQYYLCSRLTCTSNSVIYYAKSQYHDNLAFPMDFLLLSVHYFGSSIGILYMLYVEYNTNHKAEVL